MKLVKLIAMQMLLAKSKVLLIRNNNSLIKETIVISVRNKEKDIE